AKLDGKMTEVPKAADANADTNEEEDNSQSSDDTKQEVKFFSGNISSLIKASGIREMRLQRETAGSLMTERVNYLW
ncbi:MAG: hypothetical protein ACREDR_45180, partial [Blastocatellia bacterium]